jgi:hypothetical protein
MFAGYQRDAPGSAAGLQHHVDPVLPEALNFQLSTSRIFCVISWLLAKYKCSHPDPPVPYVTIQYNRVPYSHSFIYIQDYPVQYAN